METIIILSLLLAFLLVLIYATIYFTRLAIYPKVRSHEFTRNTELEQNAFDPEYLETFKQKFIKIPSIFDYDLSGLVYLQEDATAPFILICHGITVTYENSKKYAELFLKKGYSVLIYDQRNHGYNERMHTSFGYFEKYDAKACVDYILHSFTPIHLGVIGESMGAATAMSLASIDDRIKFCIEDCGYSNAFDLIKYRAQKDHNVFIAQMIYFSNILLKILYKWSFKDVDILSNLSNIQCPVLFIHGEEDDYVPFYMVHEMKNAFQKQHMIYTVPEAKHAMAYKTNKTAYAKVVDDFLNELL